MPESWTGGSGEQFRDVFWSDVLYHFEVFKTANEIPISIAHRVKVEYTFISTTVKSFVSDNTFSPFVNGFLVFLEEVHNI